MRFMRQHELQRLNEERRDAQQHFPLGQRFTDETKFVLLQIAQAAVNELGRPLRGVCCEVVFFHEKH